jgi:hypothetical protein
MSFWGLNINPICLLEVDNPLAFNLVIIYIQNQILGGQVWNLLHEHAYGID